MVIKKIDGGSEESSCLASLKLQKRKIHEWYIGGILCVAILILLTNNFGNNEKLTDYISFALTISSILLALIAIGITVLGNSNLDQRFGDLKHISGQMIDSSIKILESSNAIINKFPEFSESLSAVREKTEETNSLFKQSMNARATVGEATQSGKQKFDDLSEDVGNNNVISFKFEKFLEASSWAGRVAIYIVAKRHENGMKNVDMRAFAKYAESNGDEYYVGFQVASVASGVMNVANNGEILSVPAWNAVKIYEYMQTKLIAHDKIKTSESEKNFSSYIKSLIAKAEEFSSLSDKEMEDILVRDN